VPDARIGWEQAGDGLYSIFKEQVQFGAASTIPNLRSDYSHQFLAAQPERGRDESYEEFAKIRTRLPPRTVSGFVPACDMRAKFVPAWLKT
jgi:hypothetical protein